MYDSEAILRRGGGLSGMGALGGGPEGVGREALNKEKGVREVEKDMRRYS